MKVNEQNKAIYSRLTIDIIKKCLKKRRENPVALDTTIISDLTEDSGATPTDNPPNLPPPSLIGVNNDQISDTVTEAPKRNGGRPKGATVRASREKEEQMSRLINEIASEWNEKVKVKPEKGRMKKNELERFIEEKKAEKGLTNVCISKSCIRQCFRNNIVSAKHCGTPSPMAPIEQYIVSLMQQMTKMHQALNVSEGLSLANFLVEGTEWENKIVEFKSKRGWKPFAADGSKNPIQGAAWYNGFWKRHGHEI
jgi:hypothetical protein